jgi:flagellar biosynthesis protein FlhB
LDLRNAVASPGPQPEQFAGQAAETILTIGTRLALSLVALGLLDYARAWWSWHRQMQMSRAELRADTREAEGDPLMKKWRRQHQMERSRSRALAVLQHSDVVFVGKGRLAVATRGTGPASAVVVAKAIGPAADRLVQTARSCCARIVRDDTTARALYRGDQPRLVDDARFRSASLPT